MIKGMTVECLSFIYQKIACYLKKFSQRIKQIKRYKHQVELPKDLLRRGKNDRKKEKIEIKMEKIGLFKIVNVLKIKIKCYSIIPENLP